MEPVQCQDLPPDTVELVDELLRRLGLGATNRGRVEIEINEGRAALLWTHVPYKRSELLRFDPA